MNVLEETVSQLISMGFPMEKARNALQNTGGNLEMAVDRLLSGGFDSDNSVGGQFTASSGESPFPSSATTVVQGSTSQYSYGSDGRSACTCIALTAAEIVANACSTNDNNEGSIMTSEFLDRSIEAGVSRYLKLREMLASSSNVEHLSADEVLLKDDEQASCDGSHKTNVAGRRLFDVQLVFHGEERVRQGALSRDEDHPLGIKFVLQGLLQDIREKQRQRNRQNANDGNGDDNSKEKSVGTSMICILLTKSPETVLLCLPPTDVKNDIVNNLNNGATRPRQQYWLVDSHPRPQILSGLETSYAKSHDTMDSLLQSLREVFPFTDLGPDIPSMMSEMYNMFDMYALEARKHSDDH